jgi:4-amino-4-deoxy-L-arabinose transferase-like glycosyltransferase
MPVFQKYRFDFLFVAVITLVAAWGIVFRLGVTPPAAYPWSDESDVASDAVISLREGLEFHYPAQLAGGPVAVWLQTGWMALFGPSLTGLRVLNGLVNLTSILLLYLLARILPFGQQNTWPFSGPSFNQWLGLTAACLMAGSTWILGLARIATPNWSLVPPATILTFYFLWLALKTNQLRYFVLTGVGMGWAIYNYIPAYFIPFVPAIFLAWMWLRQDNRLPHPPSRKYLIPFPVSLIVALPILIFFALHPVAVMQRVVQLAHTNQIADVALMIQGFFDTFSSFGIWPDWLLQGRFEYVAFDPFLALLFVMGLVIAIRRRRDPVYLFLLIWWVVMIMPAFLSRSASLGFIFEMWRRGIGAQPVSFVFPALTVLAAAGWLYKRQAQSAMAQAIAPTFVAVAVFISMGSSYWLYFERWANSGVVPLFFAAGPVRLVEWMETESGADTLFIFPKRTNVSPTVRPELFTVRYMFDGPATAAYPWLDETTLDREVTHLLAEHQPAIARVMLHNRIVVDPKEYFDYALGWRGQLISREKQPDYHVFTYRLFDDILRQTPHETRQGAWFHAVKVNFGDSLQLMGQRIQPEAILAGRSLGVALRWEALSRKETDYNASVALFDRQGNELARADKPLLSPVQYLTTRHWQPGDESTIYYTLPVPADTPPGQYILRVVAYNPETGERLLPDRGQPDLSYHLANIQVWPAAMAVDPAALPVEQPIWTELVAGLQLIGVEGVGDRPYSPGDRLKITTIWQSLEPVTNNIGLTINLLDPQGREIGLWSQPQPLIVDYPTTAWPVGATYRARYQALLPATLAGNTYLVALRLVDLEDGNPLAEQALFPVTIESRPRRFEAAPLAHRANADFADAIRLNSFEFDNPPARLEPGQEIRLRLQWQALREMAESYKVFAHLTSPAGQILSQVDMLPQQGAAPTTGWLIGEVIEDELTLTIPANAPLTSYRLVTGLYNEQTGERLQLSQGDQFVLVEDGQIP